MEKFYILLQNNANGTDITVKITKEEAKTAFAELFKANPTPIEIVTLSITEVSELLATMKPSLLGLHGTIISPLELC